QGGTGGQANGTASAPYYEIQCSGAVPGQTVALISKDSGTDPAAVTSTITTTGSAPAASVVQDNLRSIPYLSGNEVQVLTLLASPITLTGATSTTTTPTVITSLASTTGITAGMAISGVG